LAARRTVLILPETVLLWGRGVDAASTGEGCEGSDGSLSCVPIYFNEITGTDGIYGISKQERFIPLIPFVRRQFRQNQDDHFFFSISSIS
jgi:hypothetical protein